MPAMLPAFSPMIRRTAVFALVTLVWVAASAHRTQPDTALHFQLERSEPAADTTVASVSEVRLWFSQGAQEGATSIRLINASGEPVPTGELTSSDDHSEHAVAVTTPLAPGEYTVVWRSMAADGHVIRDDFAFTVRAQ